MGQHNQSPKKSSKIGREFKMTDQETERQLKDMKLHETNDIGDDILITKVIGGWIYWCHGASTAGDVAGVFVPEFSQSITNALQKSD